MKIKTRPDDAGMLESDELFQMNGWLAELRNEGRAESRDDGRPGTEEDSYTESQAGRTESPGDGPSGPRMDSYDWSTRDGQARSQADTQAGSRDDGGPGPWHGQAASREDSRPGSWHGHAGSWGNGPLESRDEGRAKPPRHGYPRSESFAATPVTRPIVRARITARAVIGDQLRLPIMWCEMGPCISWFAHSAALGEADARARAIEAGWRVDAVGLLVCPQCLQTAPGFQSPRPVVLWDREEAIAMSAQLADEPGADDVASAAQELSHDLRRPASSHRDEVGAASAWLAAAVPADDVTRTADRRTSDEVRHPADDHGPKSHARPGRHRRRLAARLMFASQ